MIVKFYKYLFLYKICICEEFLMAKTKKKDFVGVYSVYKIFFLSYYALFSSSLNLSLIIAMNSEFVGFPFTADTV